jgi:hypothetical protein
VIDGGVGLDGAERRRRTDQDPITVGVVQCEVVPAELQLPDSSRRWLPEERDREVAPAVPVSAAVLPDVVVDGQVLLDLVVALVFAAAGRGREQGVEGAPTARPTAC